MSLFLLSYSKDGAAHCFEHDLLIVTGNGCQKLIKLFLYIAAIKIIWIMKGRNVFSKEQYKKIKGLVAQKVIEPRDKQKGIRASMRRLGFYITDFVTDQKGFDVDKLEGLVTQGEIIIKGSVLESKTVTASKAKKSTRVLHVSSTKKIKANGFNQFDPEKNSTDEIPNSPGNYIICLKRESKLPKVNERYQTKNLNGFEVVYTGIAGKSLRRRDYQQHFTGNAGSSTLRKSIGSLMGLTKIPRDKDPSNGKSKFTEGGEEKLSNWMAENLFLYYKENPKPIQFEEGLINEYCPPLNLDKTKDLTINKEFRDLLRKLRKFKIEGRVLIK